MAAIRSICAVLVLAAAGVACADARAQAGRDAYFSSIFGVPVVGYAAPDRCGGSRVLACVRGLEPPIYVRRDVLALARWQAAHPRRPAQPAARERAIARAGLVVVLAEWAHAGYGISGEARAACLAGQWLDDWYRHFGFSPSLRTLDERYLWRGYRARFGAAGVRCLDGGWGAPDLFTGAAAAPRTGAVRPLAVTAGWLSTAAGGPSLDAAGVAAGRVYLNLRFAGAVGAGHSVTVRWLRPDGSSDGTATYALEPGSSGYAFFDDVGAGAPGLWRVTVSADGRSIGSWDFSAGGAP